ncbi:MAG: tryptophan-rich sensory protein, partial [Nitrosopumilaceae archaeon]|nr:tryptophan-rich sensory protein [Nitrosopumilaceae archaeon]
LLIWILICFIPAIIGSQFGPGEWYQTLSKPEWNPPNWIFGPVWTVLYTLMAVSVWIIWKNYGLKLAMIPIAYFIAQLVLNALWPWFFFGLNDIWLALIDIVLLWIMILITINMFWRLNIWAGALLLPYLAWVSFAVYLNYTIWNLNK